MKLRSLPVLFLLSSASFLCIGCGSGEDEQSRAGTSTTSNASTADTSITTDSGVDDAPQSGGYDAVRPAPSFEVEGFNLADHRGEVVILNFWATWNEASVDGMSALSAMHDDLGGDGVTIVGIMQDEGGAATLEAWETENEASYSLYADPNSITSRSFGEMEFLPVTIIVDRDGIIREQHTGILSEDELLDLLGPILIEADEPLLDAPPPSQSDTVAVMPLRPEDVESMIADGAMLVDVRTHEERDTSGVIPVAEHRPLLTLAADDLPANYAVPVIFFGGDNGSVMQAANQALEWGYAHVYSIEGGITAWRNAGLPVELPDSTLEVPPLPMQAQQTAIG